MRRFVVIRAGPHYCNAIPVTSHSGRGTNKKTFSIGECASIYSGQSPPRGWFPEGLLPDAIRVDLETPIDLRDSFRSNSLLCFGKVETIEHNFEVRSIGQVHRDSMSALIEQFKRVWAAYPGTVGHTLAHEARVLTATTFSGGPTISCPLSAHSLASVHKVIYGTPGIVEGDVKGACRRLSVFQILTSQQSMFVFQLQSSKQDL